MKAIPAVTIGRPLDAFRSQYVINKGFRDGVAIDAPVVMRGSLLIGFIVETSERTSVMQTLLHPTTHLTVETVENNDEETALARGLLRSKHYTSLILTTVPRDMSLSAGQHLVTVGKETVIPYGLVVGKVTSVINREHEAYQEANLELLYNPDSIDAVHVLVSS